jgi:hypothetical protein
LTLVGLLIIGAVACGRAPANKQAVREGIIDHLEKNTGLDMKSMDVEITTVDFKGNEAQATVAFRPKASPEAGMSMNYTLERKGDKWAVLKRADSTGMSHGGGAAPPHGGMASPGAGGGLPSGHPPAGGGTDPPPSSGRK